MRSRVFLKLLASFLLVIAVSTLTLDVLVRRAWERSLREEIQRNLQQKAWMFADRVENAKGASLAGLAREEARASGARTTIIDRQGVVLADSEADPAHMENHATRPEFVAALHGQAGASTRLSATVKIEFLYVAVPISGGAVRLAYPLSSIAQSTAAVRSNLFAASALALLAAAVLAAVLSQLVARRLQRIVVFAQRIAAGDRKARIQETASDEIAQVAASLDATARKLEESFEALETSHKELQTVLESMADAVLAVSRDRRVQWTNSVMRGLMAAPAGADLALVEAVRDPECLHVIEAVLEQGGTHNARATTIQPGKTFEVTAAPMPGGGAVAVLHDLTEIERVEKTRRDFIANVSHELRTPLTSIQGYAETLLEGSPDAAQQREFLQIIGKNSGRIARLTEDLLTLARVESGEHKFRLETLSARDLLMEAQTSYQTLARQRGIELRVEEVDDLFVIADRDAIHQVFTNLIENALKYAEGSRIVLGARVTGSAAEFFVRDFGPGIASEHLPRLFERFYRVDRARSRESGGTGLGLAIVKHIVLHHGGRVRAESELGHGSTFFFSLPLVSVPVAAAVR